MMILLMSGQVCYHFVNIVAAKRSERFCKESMINKEFLLNSENQEFPMGLHIILKFGLMVMWWMGLQGFFNSNVAS